MKLPYETVMKMPIYIRKLWISRHNQRCMEEEEMFKNGGDNAKTINGESINEFAKTDMLMSQNAK